MFAVENVTLLLWDCFIYVVIPIFFALLIYQLYVLEAFVYLSKNKNILDKLPGPPVEIFWGTMRFFNPTEQGLLWCEQFVRDNIRLQFFRVRMGPFLYAIMLTHPEVIGRVLTMKANTAPKAKVYNIVKPYLGEGLLISNFQKWHTRRRLLTPAFHFEILHSYISIYNEAVDCLIGKWERSLQEGKSQLEIGDDIGLMTLDVMLRCACSYSSNCQESGSIDRKYIDAIYFNNISSNSQITYVPYQVRSVFHMSPEGFKFRKCCKIIHDHSLKVIKARRRAFMEDMNALSSGKKKKDFIDILLTATDQSGAQLSDNDIMEEMDTFLFEGHDTTSSGISWTLYLLGLHPEYQQKCRQEIRDLLQEREFIEYDDVSNLKFTTMCIKESMRIYPPVPFVHRLLTEELTIGEYTIPKGVWLILAITLCHRRPDIWEDPEKYNPYRFEEEIPGGHPFAYVPFSGGPRNCIGQKFAINEEVIAISKILNNFELISVPKKIVRIPQVITKCEGGLYVNLQKLPSH
ncbi:Phylloquinone omega-hydroxylase CYP4F2 isoform X3 [Oopsacas minuta]|uniref:Phylloquinone omega-hydroxylase CYP4F2 isoform X3 n=1 Tax=Oopsacas minuta TaxID=111878 RepID=A0AAV7JDD1_9METZ|nr:Phylloquinone omega-hydroxylase CYP4F2 isoform X3 [Oopsacas minuta]